MNYGMPYMGSKSSVIDSIALNFPKAENFYDLFGGGFSVTHYMLLHKKRNYQHFFYNEKDSRVVSLLKKALDGDFNYKKFKPEWVSRDQFENEKDNDAYISLIWSFGNNQKSYLFGQDIESWKRSLHNAVVFSKFDSTAKETLSMDSWPDQIKTIKQRRMYLTQYVKFSKKRLNCLDPLYNLQQLEQLERLEQLQRLEQLERLEQLQQENYLTISSKSYDQVEIKKNSVVYCDIPYQGTAEYKYKFDYQKFFDWAANLNSPVFISEYNITDPRFKHIYTIDKKILLSNKGALNIAGKKEKIYWNGK